MMSKIRAFAFSVLAVIGCSTSAAHATVTFPTKLFLQLDGVALSSFPGRNKLHQVVQVDRTQGTTPVTWSATSNEPWLSVTTSGQTGGKLAIAADPAQVTGTGLQLGQITVSTSGGDFTDTETIRVGFWIGTKKTSLVTLQQNVTDIATNPVEPLAYVSDGGSNISVYNVFDGTMVTKFTHVAPVVGAMEVSSDGLTLFVADMTNYKVIALNADTGAKFGSYKLGYALTSQFNMVYARPYGQPAIYAQGGPIIAYPSGDKLAKGLPGGQLVTATRDGRKVFTVVYGEDPATISSYSVDLVDDTLTLAQNRSRDTSIDDNCQDIAVSLDGNHVYLPCGESDNVDVYDDKLHVVQSLSTGEYGDNIEIDANGDVVAGIDGLGGAADDVFVFNQKGFLKGKVPATTQSNDGGQQAATMKISGDCTRVISATDPPPGVAQTLMFRNLP